ncbi:MAG: ParB/RepB/Spo0J family partition protein [Tepidisphaeraceae bacterium]|jgi:ParB family chromosome partitioning protein
MTQEQIQYLPLERIAVAPQVREHFNEESLLGLAQSLREVGLQQPIRVRRDGDKFVVVDGERRLRAARKAGFATVAVIIEEKELCSAEVILRQLVANCQRDDLGPLEAARAIDLLMKQSQWSATETASKLGLSNAAITRALSLLSLPEAIRQHVERGEIRPSAACQLASVEDAEKQASLTRQLVDGTLTRDALVGKLRAERHQSEARTSTRPTRASAKLNGGRSITIIAPALTLETLIETLEGVLNRARHVRSKGTSLKEFIKLLRGHNFSWTVTP